MAHIVHWLVEALLTHVMKPMTALRLRWEVNRGKQWTDREWDTLLANATTVPRNAKFKLTQRYITQRAYLSPDKLNKYFHTNTAACPGCLQIDADLLHMLWFCTSISTYWQEVIAALEICINKTITRTWEVCILGLYPRSKKNRATSRFTDLGLVVAKRLITKRWKHTDPPVVKITPSVGTS